MHQQICAVCCGTKRLVEIQCPADCGYLTASRHHPPAVVQRQQERDLALLWPALAGLTERQSRFFFLFQSLAVRHPADPLRPLRDVDVAEAAGSVATSLETASRGLIYDKAPQALPAQELATALRQAFEEIAQEMKGPRTPLEIDAAKALRGVEEAARRVGPLVGDEAQGYLRLLGRVLKPQPGDGSAPRPETPEASGLIIP
jgi:hypothetical protein